MKTGVINLKTWHDECGVFGIWGEPEASHLTYLGLYAIQHRGQESAGLVSLHEGKHYHHKGLGLVADVFDEDDLQRLKGSAAIGHIRYSTTGQNLMTNAQPLTAQLMNGPVALAHNGNIVNSHLLREELKRQGAIFQGTNDTECLLHLLARQPCTEFVTCLSDTLPRLHGAYSMVLLTQEALLAVRDPLGFRPLVLGRRGEAFVVASETCAFDLIGAKFEREIAPGEIFWVDQEGPHSVRFAAETEATAKCIFEHVYFARPDSVVFGHSVYKARKNMGAVLARRAPAEADVVIPVPDSGVAAALGFAEESGIPFDLGIIRNHYVGRTFIEPQQSIRSFGVKIKLNPQRALLEGKRVVVVDDSIVRGTTSRKIIGLVRQAGAKEVHLRIASPPTTGPCYYGVDTPKKSDLIGANQSIEEISEFIGADSLAYLTVADLFAAVGTRPMGFCAACFDDKYPTPLFGLDRS